MPKAAPKKGTRQCPKESVTAPGFLPDSSTVTAPGFLPGDPEIAESAVAKQHGLEGTHPETWGVPSARYHFEGGRHEWR